jgi:hypothetical protein
VAAALAAVPIVLAVIMNSSDVARPDLVLVVGLAFFGLPFAVNSSLHSYLILAYAGSEKAPKTSGSITQRTPPDGFSKLPFQEFSTSLPA